MKVHQQFDLNVNDIPKAINKIPFLVEKLIKDLIEKGYIVIESSPRYMEIPQSITVIKDFTGPFVINFSSKAKEDFKSISRALGIEKLFE